MTELTREEQDVIYTAYLGICVLQTMARKAGLEKGVQRSAELLGELGTAFPFLSERVAASLLRREKIKEASRLG
jgi:hypothetical protein